LNNVAADRYNGWDGKLSRCVNNAKDMQKICKLQGFATEIIPNEEATADAITGAIGQAGHNLRPGGSFVISYSGNGGEVPDETGDSEMGLDQTWVAFDRMIVDHELYNLWGRFEPGVRIQVYSDSCHSGTVFHMLMTPSGAIGWPAPGEHLAGPACERPCAAALENGAGGVVMKNRDEPRGLVACCLAGRASLWTSTGTTISGSAGKSTQCEIAMLRIQLLGELAVLRDGAPQALPSRKTRALLAYLVATGRPQRGLLWDVPDDPYGALHWSLSKLRVLVDEPSGPLHILTQGDMIAFAPEGVDCDLHALRDLASPANAPFLQPKPADHLPDIADRIGGRFLKAWICRPSTAFRHGAWRCARMCGGNRCSC
jgi:hypothetical protein